MREGEGINEGVCVGLNWSADETQEVLKAMVGLPPRAIVWAF